MKKSQICPKCNSTDIIFIPGKASPYVFINIGLFSSSYVSIDRYVCGKCGYSEEWIKEKDIHALKNKYQK